ncbi:MAG: response regulator [Planctomycetes bacterium]|nr:response regulator [Planctomycetota bacterium]
MSTLRPIAAVVEDEKTVATVIISMLELLGFDTISMQDEAGAVEYLENAGQLDALLTDLTLPAGNVAKLIQQCRDRHPRSHIVCMSGRPLTEEEAQALRHANASFLLKPFSLDDLRRVTAAP